MAEQRAGGAMILTLPSDLEIQMTRLFDAPPGLVYETCTQPEHLRHWWGPYGHELIVCEQDLRVGGGYRYVLRDPQGQEWGFRGEFRELVPGRRIVSTFIFEPIPDAVALSTVTLEDLGGRTRYTELLLHSSRENRDGMVGAGMEKGASESQDRLAELLARLQAGTAPGEQS